MKQIWIVMQRDMFMTRLIASFTNYSKAKRFKEMMEEKFAEHNREETIDGEDYTYIYLVMSYLNSQIWRIRK